MQTTPPPPSLRSRRARAALGFTAALAALVAGPGCGSEPCSIRDNADGTQTLACGGDEVVLGAACTSTENADGSQTIACADGTEITVSDGVSCGLDDPGDGTVTFSCSDGTEWTFAPGCRARTIDLRTYTAVVADCPDGSTHALSFEAKLAPVAQISVGTDHICGLRDDGSEHCWGDGSSGATEPDFDLWSYVQIDTALAHTCALTDDGAAICWGANDDGQSESEPGPFVQVVTGELHACGLAPDGTPVCWGHSEIAYVPDDDAFVRLTAGRHFTCGLRADATVRCWGNLSDGFFALPADERFVQIDGGGTHACGLRADGSAHCWGSNYDGLHDVPEGETFVQVTAGAKHSCGLRPDGTAVCWGEATNGKTEPQPGEVFVQLSAGAENTCGVRADGTTLCWGDASFGKNEPQWPFRCRPADAVASLEAGLTYESWSYVSGTGLPDFDALGAPAATGAMANVGLPSAGDNFALRITGYVHVAADGEYSFALTSDAGSRLRIGDDVVVDYDGLHAAGTRTDHLCLEAGWHAIAVEYFEATGPETLTLTMAAEGEALGAIAAEDLGHAL